MRSVVKSKLLVNTNTQDLNERLQKTINLYRAEGLTVRIENSYSASANVGGQTAHIAKLFDYILVVGYEKEEK